MNFKELMREIEKMSSKKSVHLQEKVKMQLELEELQEKLNVARRRLRDIPED